ncbi:MAG: hypothetical protein V4568_09705 [Pseudomonadota bacterium]
MRNIKISSYISSRINSKGFAIVITSVLLSINGVSQAENVGKIKTKDNLTYKDGRLIQAITPDGHRCTFNYAPNGDFISSVPSSCGNPKDRVKQN